MINFYYISKFYKLTLIIEKNLLAYSKLPNFFIKKRVIVRCMAY